MAPSRFWSRLTNSYWLQIFLVGASYLLTQYVALSVTVNGWSKFFALDTGANIQYWDAIHYFRLSQKAACSAFYPLWPMLSGAIARLLIGIESLWTQIALSELIFLLSLPLALYVFREAIEDKNIALLCLALYALGPNSIFYSVGYTESLFSLVSLLFILILRKSLRAEPGAKRLIVLFLLLILSVFSGLTRPTLIQSSFACLFCFLWLACAQGTGKFGLRKTLPSLTCILAGSAIGFSLYGTFCFRTIGDFLGPFRAQVEWGRTLAFRPWLLVTPRSLLIDLHGLYLPALLFLIAIYTLFAFRKEDAAASFKLPQKRWTYFLLIHPLAFVSAFAFFGKAKRYQRSLMTHHFDATSAFRITSDPVVLYSLAFSGIHSAINLAANSGYLYSTSRHFFASPFAFVVLGSFLVAIQSRFLVKIAACTWAVGLLLLFIQWLNWANGKWIG